MTICVAHSGARAHMNNWLRADREIIAIFFLNLFDDNWRICLNL